MTEKNTVRCQIVEAAKKRFSHFGYAKTTMAEVAADCSMSPGNLYRFFPESSTSPNRSPRRTTKNTGGIAKTRRRAEPHARERLHDLLFEELRRTYHKLEKDPRAYEMATVIAHERPQYANWMLANERKILVQLFDEAEQRGEFAIDDKEITANDPVCDDEVPLSAAVVEAHASQARARA